MLKPTTRYSFQYFSHEISASQRHNQVQATEADAIRLHDDISSYTGGDLKQTEG